MKIFFKILAILGCMAISAGLMLMTIVGAFALYLNVFWKFILILIFISHSLAIYLAIFNIIENNKE